MAKKKARKKRASASKAGVADPKVLESPTYSGKPTKLTRDSYPQGSGANDFRCYGPPATMDGELDDVRICDLGCFSQDGKDTNKYYHGAVVQHKKTKNWFTYFEWGRTGADHCSFQFVACESEPDARAVMAKQLHAKNDKRGEWVTIAGIRTLRAKKGKDCYLVRPMATRTTGLPDSRRIKINEGIKKKTAQKSASRRTLTIDIDRQTAKLMKDLSLATIAYTRGSMADSSLPTQVALDEARAILGEAQHRLTKLRDDVDEQAKDKKLGQLTNLLYSRIPRNKAIRAAAETWVLSRDNILRWSNDIDAYESALHDANVVDDPSINLLEDMELNMEWVAPDSKLGEFLYEWWPQAHVGSHHKVKPMRIKNLWRLERKADKQKIEKLHTSLSGKSLPKPKQPSSRPRLRKDFNLRCVRPFERQTRTCCSMGRDPST